MCNKSRFVAVQVWCIFSMIYLCNRFSMYKGALPPHFSIEWWLGSFSLVDRMSWDESEISGCLWLPTFHLHVSASHNYCEIYTSLFFFPWILSIINDLFGVLVYNCRKRETALWNMFYNESRHRGIDDESFWEKMLGGLVFSLFKPSSIPLFLKLTHKQ